MKYGKRVLSVLLCLVMVVAVLPFESLIVSATQDRSANFYKNYTTDNDPGQFMVNIASAQLGRSTSSMGYSEAWCANFVSDCARLAGQSGAIPAHSYVPTLWNNILNAGGREVYTRKAGDIIFYDCPKCDTDGDGVSLQHVGIVIDGTYSVEGNLSSSVKKVSSFTDSNGHTTSSGVIKRRYLRPNYTGYTPTYTEPPTAPVVTVGCTNLVVGEETTLSWTAAEQADHYWISCWSSTDHVINERSDGLSKTISFSQPGTYGVTVVAMNNVGETTGNWVYINVYEKPSKPVVSAIRCNNDGSVTLSWTPCTVNTLAYSIRFYEAGSTEEIRFLQCVTTETTYTYYGLPAGRYCARITAEGKGGWTHSDYTANFNVSTVAVNVPKKHYSPDESVIWSFSAPGASEVTLYIYIDGEKYFEGGFATTETYTRKLSRCGSYNYGIVAHFPNGDIESVWDTIVVEPDTYCFDLQGCLDGTYTNGLYEYGTADIYINGQLVANDVNDYCAYFVKGTAFEIKDVKSAIGRQYNGACVGSLSGIINGVTYVTLDFTTNSSSLIIDPNGGTWNGSTTTQSFKQNYNTTKAIPVPIRSGYTFTGWARSGSYGELSSTTAAATYTYGATNDVTDTITAIWSCNHDYSSMITTEPTCITKGVRTYTCGQCGNTYTEEITIDSSNHVNTQSVAAKASTCTVKGYTAGVYCNDCKKYISGHAEQPLAAHKTELRNKKNADCTTAGYTGDQYCTVCKQTITKGSATNALGHTSPDSNGNCTRCGKHIKDVTPTQPQTNPNACKYCGKIHTGAFGWLIKFFHSILAIFKR